MTTISQISKGTVANDHTGTEARDAADIINAAVDKLNVFAYDAANTVAADRVFAIFGGTIWNATANAYHTVGDTALGLSADAGDHYIYVNGSGSVLETMGALPRDALAIAKVPVAGGVIVLESIEDLRPDQSVFPAPAFASFSDFSYNEGESHDGVRAVTHLTYTSNPTDGQTVTTSVGGSVVYRFKDVIEDAGDVLIGADANESFGNFVAAIQHDGDSGVQYHADTVVNADWTAALDSGNVSPVIFEAKLATASLNGFDQATDVTGASWASVTDGVDIVVSFLGGLVRHEFSGELQTVNDNTGAIPDETSTAIFVDPSDPSVITFGQPAAFGSYQFAAVTTTGGVRAKIIDLRNAGNYGVTHHGVSIIAGNVAGNHEVADDFSANGSILDEVLQYTDGALIANLTSEFELGSGSQINNDGGTDTTGSQLVVRWRHKFNPV